MLLTFIGFPYRFTYAKKIYYSGDEGGNSNTQRVPGLDTNHRSGNYIYIYIDNSRVFSIAVGRDNLLPQVLIMYELCSTCTIRIIKKVYV